MSVVVKSAALTEPTVYDAAACGDLTLLRVLLESGCDPHRSHDSHPVWKRGPIHIAAYSGHLAVVGAPVDRGVSVDCGDAEGQTPLYWATLGGRDDVVRRLITLGADVSVTYTAGVTLLHVATWAGHVELCRTLCEAEVNINQADNDGTTPLHDGAGQWRDDMVRLFVDNGGSVNVITHGGHTPLHLAILSGGCQNGSADSHVQQPQTVATLLQAGADIETKDRHGYTALFMAVLGRQTEVCELLLDWGADVNACDTNNESVFCTALVTQCRDIATLLLERGCRIHGEGWIRDRRWPYPLLSHVALCDIVSQMCDSVSSLLRLCKLVVRQGLRPTKTHAVTKLPLPPLLKEYLAL